MSGSPPYALSRRWRSALYVVGSALAILIIAGGAGVLMTTVMGAEGAPAWVATLVGIGTSAPLGYLMGHVTSCGW